MYLSFLILPRKKDQVWIRQSAADKNISITKIQIDGGWSSAVFNIPILIWSSAVLIGWLFWYFEFHGTSATMGYLMPNSVYIYELYMICNHFLYVVWKFSVFVFLRIAAANEIWKRKWSVFFFFFFFLFYFLRRKILVETILHNNARLHIANLTYWRKLLETIAGQVLLFGCTAWTQAKYLKKKEGCCMLFWTIPESSARQINSLRPFISQPSRKEVVGILVMLRQNYNQHSAMDSNIWTHRKNRKIPRTIERFSRTRLARHMWTDCRRC